ncbi:hypothetical protein BSQ39_08340 [Loigolactobacillus backii]|nr:hypothetical protein BSQ39_08340 [Loigolactobacillus backii]
MLSGWIGELNTPTLTISDRTVKISSKKTTATLKGQTKPNVKVNIKETDGYDHLNKTVNSDSNGDFVITNLTDEAKFKVVAINGDHKSKVITIHTGDIPDSAYTKLDFINTDSSRSDSEGSVVANSSYQATAKGTSTKGAKLTFEPDSSDNRRFETTADDKGNWSINLKVGKNSQKAEYYVTAKAKGLAENSGNTLTVKNPNADKIAKAKAESKAASESSSKAASESQAAVDSSQAQAYSSSEAAAASSSQAESSAKAESKAAVASASSEDKSALAKGEEYAQTMNMSKQGVYEQLTADAGEQFSAEAGQYAIDHLTGIDWNKNALESAKSYQDMDMSPEEIRDQLTSSSGEQFTQSEADYAIQHLND